MDVLGHFNLAIEFNFWRLQSKYFSFCLIFSNDKDIV